MQLLWWPFFTTFPRLEKDGRPDGTHGGIVTGSQRDLKQQGNLATRSSGLILVFGIFFVATQSVFLSRLIRMDRVAGNGRVTPPTFNLQLTPRVQ